MIAIWPQRWQSVQPYRQRGPFVLLKDRVITRKDIYSIALLFDLKGITDSQLNLANRRIEGFGYHTGRCASPIRNRLFTDDAHQDNIIKQLWESILTKLDLQQAALHPEALLDCRWKQAEEWLAAHQVMQQREKETLQQDASLALDGIIYPNWGDSITLRGFILILSGVDIARFRLARN